MFTSPVAKLARFFKSSRDRWKAKCQLAKRENKILANQTRVVEKSRAHWKKVARHCKQQIEQLERELEELKVAGCR